ncbi:uncharacterized protein LOC107047982 [Diachasma alloeum]|uniref:uncharacterized protein LOC107047982 n=1 Tax=Diachasma alloeum TaxID=454923 RepID=UPI00073842B6|nr:uncharacterized protein LOC107047982 [Diachasma alloeum]XP_015126406.1 uncharacterized protein LOC107047982 [Diachasma alloeum]
MPGNNKKKARLGTRKTVTRTLNQSEKPSGLDLINTLNDDCLGRIFMYLDIWDRLKIQKVCKRWKENPRLAWGDLRVLDSDKRGQLPLDLWDNAGIARILRQAGRFVRELRLVQLCTSLILPVVAENCHNLTTLEVELPYHDMTCIKWFPKMDGLMYFRMQANSQHFSENFFQTLPHESLIELHLTVCSTDSRIPAYVPRAAASAIEKLTKLTDLTLNRFALTPHLLASINQNPNLTSLALPNCSVRRGVTPLNRLVNLEYLNLAKILEVDDQLVMQISDTCKKLKSLNLSDCHNLTDNGISKLHNLQLEELYLSGVFRITDLHLAQMHTLRKLECHCCSNIHDNGILTLMRSAPNLECLNLWSTGVSSKVLTEAATIIRQRNTDVPFRIFASLNVRPYIDDDDWFPFLIINHRSRMIDSSSSDDSSDTEDAEDDD